MSRSAIFITGAAAGIGRATAQYFAGRGWFVGLYDVDVNGVERLRAQLPPGQACAGTLDVSDGDAFAGALAQFFQEAGGRLDLLFNCAGILTADDFEKIPLARHHAIIDVNFKGLLNGCHAALPYLRQTAGARVINMSSASAFFGTPGFASYSASKCAVKGFTEALNIEWARYGIPVRDVLPLFVGTGMIGDIHAGGSLKRLGVRLQAEDIAVSVWRATHWPRWWPRVHWLPGLQTAATYLLMRLSPVWLNRWVSHTGDNRISR